MRDVSSSGGFRAAACVLLPALTVVLLAATTGCTGGDGKPAPSQSKVGVLYDSKQAADGGEVRVVDSGFLMMPPDASALETNRVQYGIVLENTSKVQAAVDTRLTVRLLDADGTPVFTVGTLVGGLPESAPAVLPGRRTGVGDELATTDKASASRTAVRIEVLVGNSTWTPPDQLSNNVTASKVTVVQDMSGSLAVTYTVTSTAQRPITNPRIDLIFRTSGGKVIGGRRASIRAGDVTWPSGTSEQHQVLPGAPPSGADLGKTDVYLRAV